MAHFPKPFFKKARRLWYVEINRKQINLGPDREAAFATYHQLMAQPRTTAGPTESVILIIENFLDWVYRHRSEATYEWYRHRLQRFALKYPELTVSELRPFHVEQWVDDYDITVTTRHNYFRSIKTCLKWAAKQGYIDASPIASMEVPSPERREVYIPPPEFEQLLTHVGDQSLRDLLIATYHTGCRPQESLRLESRHVELRESRWVFPHNESKGKRSPRVVYLDETASEITNRLLANSKGGHLFRNSRGRPWTKDAVNCAIDRIRVRMGKLVLESAGVEPTQEQIAQRIKTLNTTKTVKGVKKEKSPAELRSEAKRKVISKMASEAAPRYCLYALRHSWATNALKRGLDSLTVAMLMGHKDPSMLARVYQHLSHSPDHMREQAKRATED